MKTTETYDKNVYRAPSENRHRFRLSFLRGFTVASGYGLVFALGFLLGRWV